MWRSGSSPVIELVKAYQKIEALCVSSMQEPRTLGQVARNVPLPPPGSVWVFIWVVLQMSPNLGGGGHKLTTLEYIWPWDISTIRRCGLAGVSVALLEEVCHYGGKLWWHIYSSHDKKWYSLLLLPADQDRELSAPPVPCLPGCHHVCHHGDNGLNIWNCKPAPIKCFPL